MNTLDIIFWLLCIRSPPRSIVLTLRRSPYTSYVDYVNTYIELVDTTDNPTWNFEITYSSFYTS